MELSFTEIIKNLQLLDIIFLIFLGVIICYITIAKQVHILMFLLIMSASFVGSTIPIVSNIAPVVRWLILFLLLFLGLSGKIIKIPLGVLLFWGYLGIGFISLFWAINIGYQLQRGVLLLGVAFTLPLVFSNMDLHSIHQSLEGIAIAASIFCIINFIVLPSSLRTASRFLGLAKAAPSLALFMGSLLPFTLWGLWRFRRWVRVICIAGFVSGTITLVFSGQRTGTIAGIIGLLPLLLMMQSRKNLWRSLIMISILIAIGVVIYFQSDISRNEFLLNRYNINSGLTGRLAIWQKSLSKISGNPIIGYGFGAAEMTLSYSFHNAYLEIWYNTGILGMALFLSSQVIFLWQTIHFAIITKNSEVRGILMLALGFMGGFIISCIFESTGSSASSVSMLLYLSLSFIGTSNILTPKMPVKINSSEVRLANFRKFA